MRGKIPFDPHIIIFLYTEEIMFKKGVVPSQGLRIIIVGCGKVGRTLVEQLGKEYASDIKLYVGFEAE